MSTVCLCANTLCYPEGGGHRWAYLNWALGLSSLGYDVIWMELVAPSTSAGQVRQHVATLARDLARYGLRPRIALASRTHEPLLPETLGRCLPLDTAAAESELVLSMHYDLRPDQVTRFRRSALLDIDPGLLQIWVSKGRVSLPTYDAFFTIGETVGAPGARCADLGLEWHHVPPCVALDWWRPRPTDAAAPFTTVAHWFASAWIEEDGRPEDKRSGFLPFLELPRLSGQPLELATDLGPEDQESVIAERAMLLGRGWRLRDPHAVASTPWDYQGYIGSSRGEFSCAKPAYVQLQNAWISDRTVCYLASGKPAVVQHTGPSRFLPDAAGLFRFVDLNEAARSLETVAADYERQSRLARALAEEYFDARKVVARVLERTLP